MVLLFKLKACMLLASISKFLNKAILFYWVSSALLFALPSVADNHNISPENNQAVNASAVHTQVVVRNGVLQWSNGEEIALFGVNYNAPFAFTYRAIKRSKVAHKSAIDMDLNHLQRLGVQAYRVHLWDRELSDNHGNLLNNTHLELFDYLLAQLAQKNIKVIVTMMSWWGSGYPEPDPKETGFSTLYAKQDMNNNLEAIAAQKNYIGQLLAHTNTYTNLTYGNDPNIIAFELFNEPKHLGTADESANYIEGLIAAARAAKLTKPLFYNISEQGDQQDFAKAVCNTAIDGIAYQWYPTGLVSYSTLQANMLPTVATYRNPFAAIEACQNKAKMVYEFDAADVASSVMYPAMARSFRQAGFQWATQFAYDPAVIAHTNAEYNTHYLNLLYTPSKAVSFLIAGEVFRSLPRGQNQGSYPQNNHFGDVSLSYEKDLSLLNSEDKFYYSNATQASPKSLNALAHIAGVGRSPVVDYQGSGAYFLDQLAKGLWQLEVYPDLQVMQDPFVNSSLGREVGRLYRNSNTLKINLPDLGKRFYLRGINSDNKAKARAEKSTVTVGPGIYLIANSEDDFSAYKGAEQPNFYLPKIKNSGVTLWHQPVRSTSQKDKFKFVAQVGAKGEVDKVELLLRRRGWSQFNRIAMQAEAAGKYSVNLPSEEVWSAPGPLEYVFVVTQKGQSVTFPGAVNGSPSDWDFIARDKYFSMEMRPWGAPITLLDPEKDRANLVYPKDGRANQDYTVAQDGRGVALRLGVTDLIPDQYNPLTRITPAKDTSLKFKVLTGYNSLLIKIRAVEQTEYLAIGVLDKDSLAYTKTVEVGNEWQYMIVPLRSLTRGKTILPKAYPIFMPSVLESENSETWPKDADLNEIQGIQLAFDEEQYQKNKLSGWHAIDVAEISLIRR